jgi:hypothetical protein
MARSAGNRTRREEAGRVIRPLVIQEGDRDWLDGRVEVVAMLGKSGADIRWGRRSGNAMIDMRCVAAVARRMHSVAAREMSGPGPQEISP